MSEFHGGYFVVRTDPEIVEAIYERAKAYVATARGAAPQRVCFAWRPGSPVVHVALRGGDADGKGYAYWHEEHCDLGGHFARALKCEVWAYAYENQVGSEMTAHFNHEGRLERRVKASWDEFAGQLGLDPIAASAADSERLFSELPLGQLAKHLGVGRDLLDKALAYDTPSAEQSLDSPCNRHLLEHYFDEADGPPREVLLFFQEGVLEDLREVAYRSGLKPGEVVWLAWELSKPDIYQLPSLTSEGHLAPKPPRPPKWVSVSVRASALPDCPEGGERVSIHVELSTRVAEEVKELADFLDRSTSWLAGQAYRMSRAKLWGVAEARATASDRGTPRVP